jgi:hypothetical protein
MRRRLSGAGPAFASGGARFAGPAPRVVVSVISTSLGWLDYLRMLEGEERQQLVMFGKQLAA